MNDAKGIIKRYQKRARTVEILTVFAILAALALQITIVVKILLVIGLLLLEIVVLAVLMTRTSNSLLTRDLDPELYYMVSHGIGAAAKNDTVDITAAYYMNDYHTAYNLCVQKLENTGSTAQQYWYKMILSRIYFDTGEIEKLREICEDFHAAFAQNRYLSSHYGQLMAFYSLYCDGSFASCCELYMKRMEETQYKQNALVKTQIDYAYAVARYQNGDWQEAAVYFNQIVQTAPKLNFAHIAQNYLDAIESGEEVVITQACVREDDFTPPTCSSSKPSLSKWIITGVVLFVGFLVIGVSLYQSRPQEPLAALKAYDDTVQAILTMISVNEQEDALCVYQNANDLLGIAYLDARGENRYQCKITSDGTEAGWYYTVEASDSDLKMSCVILEKEQNIPQTSVAYSMFDWHGKTYTFVIETLADHSCWGYSVYLDDPEQMQAVFEEFFNQTA